MKGMYNKHNLEVYKFASTSPIKPELGCVAFFGNKTVATDSFRLVEVSADGEAYDPILIQGEYVKRLKLGPKDLVGIDSFPDGRVTAEFPDYESIIAKEEGRDEVVVKVNGKLLGEVLLQLAKLNKFGTVNLSIGNDGGYRPIIIKTESNKDVTESKQKGRGLVMPIRGN